MRRVINASIGWLARDHHGEMWVVVKFTVRVRGCIVRSPGEENDHDYFIFGFFVVSAMVYLLCSAECI